MHTNWRYNEFDLVGKDYRTAEEVAVYDETHRSFRDVDAENRFVMETLGLKEGDSVVDFGCGTGAFSVAAAKCGCEVTGVDISEEMLNYARSRAVASGVGDSVQFQRDGYLTFERSDGSVDAVCSSFSFHHLPDFWKAVTLERIHKLLKSGGKFFLHDVVLPDEGAVDAVKRFIAAQENMGGYFMREDAEQHFREEFSTYDWILVEMLKRAGFDIVWSQRESEVIASYLCVKRSIFPE